MGPKMWWIGLVARVGSAAESEDGMTTAELLGNAALGIAALCSRSGRSSRRSGSTSSTGSGGSWGSDGGPRPRPRR